MKFIRKNGRVIPIDPVKSQFLSSKGPSEGNRLSPAAYKKYAKQPDAGIAKRALMGFKVGSNAGIVSGVLFGALNRVSMLKGAAIGSLVGGTILAGISAGVPYRKKSSVDREIKNASNIGPTLAIGGAAYLASKSLGINKASILKAGNSAIRASRRFRTTKGRDGNIIFGKFPKK